MIEDIISEFGYVPEDDSWDIEERRTYVHEDNTTRAFQKRFQSAIALLGWVPSTHAIRTFYAPGNEEMIELEPGGSDVTGHFLHLMRRLDDDAF